VSGDETIDFNGQVAVVASSTYACNGKEVGFRYRARAAAAARAGLVDRSLQSVESRLAVLHRPLCEGALTLGAARTNFRPGRVASARQQGMEPLWSPAVATGGKRLRQPKTVAVGCDRLPEAFHGKEGVVGSSSTEGFQEPAARGGFSASCAPRTADDSPPLESTWKVRAVGDDWLCGERRAIRCTARRPASGQSDYEFGLDLILDGLERTAYR